MKEFKRKDTQYNISLINIFKDDNTTNYILDSVSYCRPDWEINIYQMKIYNKFGRIKLPDVNLRSSFFIMMQNKFYDS